MQSGTRTTAFCIFCQSNLFLNIKNGKYFLAPICLRCRRAITAELGNGWEQSEWWEEMKSMYYVERNQEWKNQNFPSFDEVPNGNNIFVADLYGNQVPTVDRLDYTIEGIVRRLYRTYGFGSRRIHSILTSTYKLSVSRRKIAYMLSSIKSEGLEPDEDAKFWHDWYQSLERYEKEYGIENSHRTSEV